LRHGDKFLGGGWFKMIGCAIPSTAKVDRGDLRCRRIGWHARTNTSSKCHLQAISGAEISGRGGRRENKQKCKIKTHDTKILHQGNSSPFAAARTIISAKRGRSKSIFNRRKVKKKKCQTPGTHSLLYLIEGSASLPQKQTLPALADDLESSTLR